MKKLLTFAKVEGKLGIRCIDVIFFGILMPMGIALLIGAIAGSKPAFDGSSYTFIQSSFASLITVGICATAFMGIPLSISDYRDKKILKHFFVTPASPGLILLVSVVNDAILAVISSLGVFIIMKLIFGYTMTGSILKFILSYILVLISMYSLGMLMASLCKSVKMTNLVCTLVYFPMLFLSGATIPYEIFPEALQKISNILPLTQGIKLLKGFSLGLDQGSLIFPICVMIIISIISILISIKSFRWE